MKVKTKTKTLTKGTKGGRGGLKGKTRGPSRRRDSGMMRKKFCRLCVEKAKSVDYKEVRKLEGYIRDRGKIVSSRISGNCAKHQRRVVEAIKKARFISLLPYVR